MPESELDISAQLDQILNEIETSAPLRHQENITYRTVQDEEPINDADDDMIVAESQEQIVDDIRDLSLEVPDPVYFEATNPVPLSAVDCGIARLGETKNGHVIALRAANIIEDGGRSAIDLYKTGVLYLLNDAKLHILHLIGEHLLKGDHFVEIDTETDPENPRPTRVKSGVADETHKYGDRFRNWLERLIQRIAVSSIRDGVVLFDGALTVRTIDTPQIFLERLADEAESNGNAIIAISKQSRLTLAGQPLQFWLDDVPNRCCYRNITAIMRDEARERFMGNIYAARFSPIGPTFRMDVKSLDGQTDAEAINTFFGSAIMRCGYPDILVRAHTYSYFTPPDVVQLQAQAGARFQFRPLPEPNLSGIFAPFGGRYK